MRHSLESLKQLQSRGCEISVATCSALCQDGQRWQEAISFESEQDVAFYEELLGAVTWAKASLLLAALANAKLQLNSATYSTAVRTCHRRQDFSQEFLKSKMSHLRAQDGMNGKSLRICSGSSGYEEFKTLF